MARRTNPIRYRVELSGLSEILAMARKAKDKKRALAIMKKAIRAAGALLLKQMRRSMKRHDRTGWLRKSLKSKLKYYKRSGTLVMLLGVASKQSGVFAVEQRLGKAKRTIAKNIVSHNYAHLVFGSRKAFTQQITYTNKNGRTVSMRRRIAGYNGENVIETVVKTYGAQAKARMVELINTELAK